MEKWSPIGESALLFGSRKGVIPDYGIGSLRRRVRETKLPVSPMTERKVLLSKPVEPTPEKEPSIRELLFAKQKKLTPTEKAKYPTLLLENMKNLKDKADLFSTKNSRWFWGYVVGRTALLEIPLVLSLTQGWLVAGITAMLGVSFLFSPSGVKTLKRNIKWFTDMYSPEIALLQEKNQLRNASKQRENENIATKRRSIILQSRVVQSAPIQKDAATFSLLHLSEIAKAQKKLAVKDSGIDKKALHTPVVKNLAQSEISTLLREDPSLTAAYIRFAPDMSPEDAYRKLKSLKHIIKSDNASKQVIQSTVPMFKNLAIMRLGLGAITVIALPVILSVTKNFEVTTGILSVGIAGLTRMYSRILTAAQLTRSQLLKERNGPVVKVV